MKYNNTKNAIFLHRPNRFLAQILVDGREEIVHVKNTGRLKELLSVGARVIIAEALNPDRKTKYSLIAVYKGDVLFNIDSQVPNAVVQEGLLDGKVSGLEELNLLSRERVFGNSRFDLYYETKERQGFIEVKGVTLEAEGIAMFPDAPTERGTKHIYEMIKAVEEGYSGSLFFLLQMKGATYFTPNKIRDPQFTKALILAKEKGVQLLAYDSIVSEDEIRLGDPVRIKLQ